MSIRIFKTTRLALIAGVSAFALLAGAQIASQLSGGLFHDGSAYAQQGRGKGGPGGGGGAGGGGAGGGGGGAGGGGGSATHGGSGSGGGEATGGSGQGGPSADSDAKGPKYQGGDTARKPAEGTRGGKPVWAQEGIPEVELGRLSVARSPDQVINKALAEAIANFNPTASAALYSMTAEQFAAYVKANYDTVTRIDSPLENLGLYKDVLADGTTQLPSVTPASTIDLAAIFLGSASDKTIPVTKDTVIAVTKIMELPALTDAQITSLAEKAEAVRLAIAEGHG